jgi:hypothetical protein
MKNRGYIADRNGEVHRAVPGITVSESESVPTVALTPDASDVIGQAWRDGLIEMPGLLALPAGEADGA